MVSKDEWQEWKMSAVTKELLELLKIGYDQAVNDLVAARGQDGDFYRGACVAYEELSTMIKTGDGLLEEEHNV